MKRPSTPSALMILLAVAATGCGHPATEQECEEIFQHSAEIELRAQNIEDPKQIAERVAEAKAAKGDALMRDCIGKRITESAMQCVRSAKTGEELDACLK